MVKRKRLATYDQLKPLFEWLYDQLGIHWSQAMILDNRLFTICCEGATETALGNLLERVRREALATKPASVEFEQELLADNESGSSVLDTAVNILAAEFDYDESYNTLDVDKLYSRPAPPPQRYTHDELPPFEPMWHRPEPQFTDCYYCGRESTPVYSVRMMGQFVEICRWCVRHINSQAFERAERMPYDETRMRGRYM